MAATITRRGGRAFRSLRAPSFRWLWLGYVVEQSGVWLETVARSWLVWEMTHDAFLVTVVHFCRWLPFLVVSPLAGVLADRLNRRSLLLTTLGLGLIQSLSFGLLVSMNWINLWWIMLMAAGGGTVATFGQTIRQSLVPNLVGRELLMNAVALNSSVLHITRIAGPALGGFLVLVIGVDGVLYLKGLHYVAAIAFSFFIKAPPTPSQTRQASPWGNLREGLGFVVRHPVLRGLALLGAAVFFFGFVYIGLMPVFAGEVLHMGPEALGLLHAATGVGAVFGAFGVASLREFPRRGLALLGAILLFGIAMVVFSLTRELLWSLLLLAAVGGTNAIYTAFNQTIMQGLASDAMRGRVMSVDVLAHGLNPFGTLLAGWIAQNHGVALAFGVMGAFCALLGLTGIVALPSVRRA